MNPTKKQLEDIAEELARLDSLEWFKGKEASVTFNEDAKVFRVETTDKRAFNDISLDLVQKVWLDRQIDEEAIIERIKGAVCIVCEGCAELSRRVEKLEQKVALLDEIHVALLDEIKADKLQVVRVNK